ncbi:hypothetical protein [Bartonella senegalensis]|nr:hypothetical protein [Bartonella senegalensis]
MNCLKDQGLSQHWMLRVLTTLSAGKEYMVPAGGVSFAIAVGCFFFP